MMLEKKLSKLFSEESRKECVRQDLLLRIILNFGEFKWRGSGERCDDGYMHSSFYILQTMGFIPKIWEFNTAGLTPYSLMHYQDLEKLQKEGLIFKLDGYVLGKEIWRSYYREQPSQKDKLPPECVQLLKQSPSEIVWRLAQIMQYSKKNKTGMNFNRTGGAKKSYGISDLEYRKSFSLYKKLIKLDPKKQVFI